MLNLWTTWFRIKSYFMVGLELGTELESEIFGFNLGKWIENFSWILLIRIRALVISFGVFVTSSICTCLILMLKEYYWLMVAPSMLQILLKIARVHVLHHLVQIMVIGKMLYGESRNFIFLGSSMVIIFMPFLSLLK